MAAQYIPIKRVSSLDVPITAEKLDGSLFTTENQAHEFIISVRKNGVKQTVTGGVTGKFIRANGTTIFLQGSIVDGDAVVRLHQDCYNVQGRFTFNIFNSQDGVTTCIYSAVGKIDMGSTETVIDAGDVVPDVSDVVAKQEEMTQVIADARTATSAANTAAQNVGSIVARPYSPPYKAGEHCTQNGNLYKAMHDIPSDEEWTASHWTQIVMGDEVTNLKSALSLDDIDIEKIKSATVTKVLGSEIAYTDNEEGVYWRFINGAWQKVHTSGSAYNHIVTYPVTAGKVYRVTGRHGNYFPLATFWTTDGTAPIGCTEDGYSATQVAENITLDVIVPEGATKMLVTAFPLGTFPTVKEITYENSMSVAQKIADQVFYYTFDENFVSFEETNTGLNITLPYRFYIHYLKPVGSVQKTLATGVSSVTYECPNNDYLVFDLKDNQVKHWGWGDISSANKDDYILFANINSKNITGGILKPYFNRYKIKQIEAENYPRTLNNLRESALTVEFDTNFVKFERTTTGLDITLPYRCFIIGDKSGTIYEKRLNGLTTGAFTVEWNLVGFVILDITTGNVSVVGWSDMFTQANPFIVLASRGKRVNVNGIYYPLIGDGALLPYFNQYMITEVDSERNNGRIAPPYYYFIDDYLPNKAISIRNKAKSADVSFGFLTDYHVGFNTGRSMLLMKYIADKTNAVPFVLFGGDVPKATGTEADALAAGDDWLKKASIFGKDKVFQCKGNHDYMINITGEPTFHADIKTDYYYICKPTEGKVNGEPGKLYYYFDDDVNKVRYIVLDNYDAEYSSGNYNTTGMSQTQYDWLINCLDVDGYDVLVLSHQTSDPTLRNYESVLEPLQEILKAFVTKGTLSYSGNGVSLSKDFTGTTSRLICHLSGHSHDDEAHVDNGVLSIVSVCDAYYTLPSGYNRTYATIDEQAIDIFCITKDSGNGNGSIEIVRIGAGSDRHFTY